MDVLAQAKQDMEEDGCCDIGALMDEIERLRAAFEVESALREHWGKQWEEQYAENERLRADLGAAYAELRKQSGNVRGIFDRDVWDRALAAPKPEDGK